MNWDKALCQGRATRGLGSWWWSPKPTERELAKEMCRRCPIRQECLEYGLAIKSTNMVWGGEEL